MRDIRGDLQDRASFLEEQISAAQVQFEKRMELFTREHEAKINDLRAEFEAVTMLMEREYRRIMSVPEMEEDRREAMVQSAPEPQHHTAPELEHFDEPELAEGEAELELRAEAEAPPVPEPYREPVAAEAEPAREPAPRQPAPRQPAPVEAARPVRRAPEPQQPAPPATAQREADSYRRPAATEARPRRPIPVEERAPESRSAVAHGYHRAPSAHEPERGRGQAEAHHAQPQPPLADFLIRQLGEVGAMSLDDLCHSAIKAGYFAEGDNPDRTVNVTLMNVVNAGFIRQLPNGTFAPATVMDTIRLRRTI